MLWECTECGGLVRRIRRPTVCPTCGIGGSLFVPAGTDPEDGVLDGSFREAWLEYGMNWPGQTLIDGPGLEPEIAAWARATGGRGER